MTMGLSALIRPRTRGWTNAREAIETYVEEQQSKQRKALGLSELIDIAKSEASAAAGGAQH
jgi:hypothetical protein